ncbi:MAG: rhomboid family intramembrane serine protease [Desulfococcaceae bacterium]
MSENDSLIYRNVQIAFGIIAILWTVHLADMVLPADLRVYGLRPRSQDGLIGIVCYPFLHNDFRHLIGNSGTLFILLIVSLSMDRRMTVFALLIIIFLGGAGVWLFGKPGSIHIGASGVIFGLIGFLLFIGIFRKNWKTLLFSIAVFLAYGSALWSLLLIQKGVSWSGHFWGFVSGVTAAWQMRRIRES